MWIISNNVSPTLLWCRINCSGNSLAAAIECGSSTFPLENQIKTERLIVSGNYNG